MKLFRKLRTRKPVEPFTYATFWEWFVENEQDFYELLKEGDEIMEGFIHPVSAKLNRLREGYYLLVGMYNEDTAELIFSAEGLLKNIAFAEDLVQAAPHLDNWKFTSLKPSTGLADTRIEMEGIVFDQEKIQFYAVEEENYPDLISLNFVHEDCTAENVRLITNGVHVYLAHILGEENYVSIIDKLEVVLPEEVNQDLVPIEKINDYLLWRQKEFVEKYTDTRRDTEQDNYRVLEADLDSGNRLVATVNSDLLNWESKASHPWILMLTVQYDTKRDDRLPDEHTADALNAFEDLLLDQLKDKDGYLNIGRESCNGIREIYFACQEFRECSRIVDRMIKAYQGDFKIHYGISKDKYWRMFESYGTAQA